MVIKNTTYHTWQIEFVNWNWELPKFEEDLFKTSDNLYLIPTAELLTNIYRDVLINEEQL